MAKSLKQTDERVSEVKRRAEERKKKEEEERTAGDVKRTQEVEEARPSQGKPRRAPWGRVKEVKEAEREAQRLKEAADRAQTTVLEKRAALHEGGKGSSAPSASGSSGVTRAGGSCGGPGGVAKWIENIGLFITAIV